MQTIFFHFLIFIALFVSLSPVKGSTSHPNNHSFLAKQLIDFELISPASLNEEAILDELASITVPTQEDFVILEELLLLDPEAQQIALNQLAALPYTNVFQIAELNTRKFLRRLYDPLRKIAVVDPQDMCGCVNEYRIGGWFDAGYDRSHINTSDCFEDYTFKGYDFSIGAQMSMTPCWTLGVAASYEHDKLNYQLNADGNAQTYLVGMYSLLRPADYYLLGDLIAGYGQHTIKRQINIGNDGFVREKEFKRNGHPKIYQGMAYLEGGKDLPLYGCLNTYIFQPFLGLEVGYFRYQSIKERADNPLFDTNIASRSHVTFSGRLGLHFSTTLFSCLSVYADAAWQHRCTSLDNHIRQRFVQFGNQFSITGLHLDRDSFDGAINLSLSIENNLRLYIEAAGLFWNNAATYNTFAGIQLGW